MKKLSIIIAVLITNFSLSYAGVYLSEGNLILKNSKARFSFSIADGLILNEISQPPLYRNYVLEADELKFLTLLVEGLPQQDSYRFYQAKDFKVEDIKIEADVAVLKLQLKDIFKANLSLWLKGELPLLFGKLKLESIYKQPLKVMAGFPVLSDVMVGDRIEDNWYIAPVGGGGITNAFAELRYPYGGHGTLQLIDVFNPYISEGFYIRANTIPNWIKYIIFNKKLKVSLINILKSILYLMPLR